MTVRAVAEQPPWLVRIRRSPDAAPSGVGMLVDGRHVITCAHVVADHPPAERPLAPVFVDFQFLDGHDPIAARVVEGGWHPASGTTADVAVLALEDPPPEQARPAPLRTTERDVSEHRIWAYGYTQRHPTGGVSALGEVVGRAEAEGWLQLQALTAYGQALEPGFSGSPVWDRSEPGVIGMVVTRARSKVDPRTGFALPVEALARYWPALGASIRESVTDPDEERRRLEALLRVPLGEDGELPRVRDIDIYAIGVTRSTYVARDRPDPRYVPRTRLDERLDAALAGDRMVLAIGDSTAGKSRATIELLRRRMPDARLIAPLPGPAALRDLTKVALPLHGEPAVLWLDELDRFLGPKGIDGKVLDHFERHDPPVKIVATITYQRQLVVSEMQGEPGQIARDVLARPATPVQLDKALAPEDREEARRHYPDVDVDERGFGEQLVAAPALERRYMAAHEASRAGWAVIRAAADWGRIAVDAPLPEPVLRELFSRYYRAEYSRAPQPEDFAAGLDWAQQPVAGFIAPVLLVAESDEPAFTAFEYLRALLDGQTGEEAAPIPRFTWELATRALDTAALLTLSFAAITRAEFDAARAALTHATGAQDDPISAAWAMLLLGELELSSDMEAGRALLERAANCGFSDIIPLAQIDLANVALNTNDTEYGVKLLEAAYASGHPEAAPLAQVSLGGVLQTLGDIDRALELLEPALQSDDPSVASLAQARLGDLVTDGRYAGKTASQPAAARAMPATGEDGVFGALRASAGAQVVPIALLNLGRLYATQGQRDRARELIEASMRSENPNVAPVAQINMAMLLAEDGDWERVEPLLESAMESSHPFAAPLAAVTLGALLMTRGEVERARALLEPVAEGTNPEQAPRAADLLGDLYAAAGDVAAAAAAYQRAIDFRHPDWSPMAQVDLATMLANEGQPERAQALLEDAEGSGHPYQAPRAADTLGDLHALEGDAEAAEAAYGRAMASEHPDWGPIAQIDLAVLVSGPDPARSRRLLEEIAGSDHPHQAPRATGLLGELFAAQGESKAAIDAYERAIATAHPELSPIARINLAVLVGDAGELERAAEQLTLATEAINPATAAEARLYLGVMRIEQGDPAAGREQLERAEESGIPRAVLLARYHLAKLDAREGDVERATERLLALVDANDSAAPGTRRIAEAYLATLRSRGAGGEDATFLDHAEELFDGGEIDEAEEALQAALELGGLAARPRAEALLGAVLLAQGDLDRARQLLEQALSAGDPQAEPMARRYLGSVLARQGERERAREVLQPLAASEDAKHRPMALVLLGRIALLDGDMRDALRQFESAVATGEPEAVAQAREGIDELPAVRLPELAAAPARPDPGAPLPPLLLVLIGEVALAEGAETEAREWFERAKATGDPEACARVAGVSSSTAP